MSSPILRAADVRAVLSRIESPGGAFPEPELDRMRAVFQKYKKVGDYTISMQDLDEMLAELDYLKISDDKIMEFAREVTPHHDSELDAEEFIAFMDQYASFEREEVFTAFDAFDPDGLGKIKTSDVELALEKLGYQPFKAQAKQLATSVDADSDGILNFDEFVTFLALYQNSSGFSSSEVTALHRSFSRFADEAAEKRLVARNYSKALLHVFGPQAYKTAKQLAKQMMHLGKKYLERRHSLLESPQAAGRPARESTAARPAQAPERRKNEMNFHQFVVWASRLRQAELKRYIEQFHHFDADHNNLLDSSEVACVMRQLGYRPLRQNIRDVMDRIDKDHNEQIDVDEFCSLMDLFHVDDGFTRAEIQELQAAFRRYDRNDTGEIQLVELHDILTYLGLHAYYSRAQKYVLHLDFNASNLLDWREFIRLMRLLRERRLRLMHAHFEKASGVRKQFGASDEKQPGAKGIFLLLKKLPECLQTLGLMPSDEESAHIMEHAATQAAIYVPWAKHPAVDFDSFVEIVDRCSHTRAVRHRKQAGFIDSEIESWRDCFERFDTNNNGTIEKRELTPFLNKMGLMLHTVDDQADFVNVVQKARAAGREMGLTEEEVGPDSAVGLQFYHFLHFMRILLKRQEDEFEKQKHGNFQLNPNFSHEQVQELKQMFCYWVHRSKHIHAKYQDNMFARRSSDEDVSRQATEDTRRIASATDFDDGLASGSDLMSDEDLDEEDGEDPDAEMLLHFEAGWQMVQQLGAKLERQDRPAFRQKCIDFGGKVSKQQQDITIDFVSFIMVINWMYETHYGGMTLEKPDIDPVDA